MGINNLLSTALINLKSRKIKDKILIIESDDWGAIRMPNVSTYFALLNKGIPVDKSLYCKYDTLESNKDVEDLIDVLLSVKNANGEHPVFTANFVSANPDFDKIRQDKFNNYYFEPITETYKKYNSSDRVIDIVLSSNLFKPQFHGREHVNVPLWMELLKTNMQYRFAFDYNLWGLSNDVFPLMKKSVQATYDNNDYYYCRESIIEGLNLFEKIFGFKSNTFISNNFIWSNELENVLYENGVSYLQGMKYQLLPLNDKESKRKKIRHYLGEKNQKNQYYGVRNCSFEPILFNDTVESVMHQISLAFLFKKPAIISTHRINFVSGLSAKNSEHNLKLFKELLNRIVKKWPDAIFLSSDKLYKIFEND
ncbi:MAG: hypothetical protein ACK4K9_05595 [Bacteroidia bacterium]